MAAQLFQGALSICSFIHGKSLCRQSRAKKASDRRLVIDDKNTRRGGDRGHAALPSDAGSSGGTLNVIVKIAPRRSWRFPAVIGPPIASTKPLLMASPRPVPAGFRSVA